MQELLKLIQERRSTRMAFDAGRPVPKDHVRQILEAGRWAPTAHNMQNFEIVVVDDKKLLSTIGTLKTTVTETFIRENYQHLSFSEEELLEKKVGILGTNFPQAWRTAKYTPDKDEDLTRPIQTSPVMLFVVYDPSRRAPDSERDFLGIVSLGCVMENMWLMANSLGISFHIVSAIGRDPVEKELKRLLNIPERLKIPFVFRLGYPLSSSTSYVRARRDSADFAYHNQYGCKGLD